jgi:hypothetical protein
MATITGITADHDDDVEEDIVFGLSVTDCYGTTSSLSTVTVTVTCSED